MAITIVKNPWVMKKVILSDGSAVFNLEDRSMVGRVVRIACYDRERAESLQMALGECASYVEVDEVPK